MDRDKPSAWQYVKTFGVLVIVLAVLKAIIVGYNIFNHVWPASLNYLWNIVNWKVEAIKLLLLAVAAFLIVTVPPLFERGDDTTKRHRLTRHHALSWIATLVIVIVAFGAIQLVNLMTYPVSVTTPQPSYTPEPAALYLNPALKIMLWYPQRWSPTSRQYAAFAGLPLQFTGTGGFFELAATGTPGTTLRAAAEAVAAQLPVHPGGAPQMSGITVDGVQGLIIEPTGSPQATAALVVPYPFPVTMDGTPRAYLVLRADVQHIRRLAAHTFFVENASGELSGPPNIIVYAPHAGDAVLHGITVSGVARVFENTLTVRLRNATPAMGAPSAGGSVEVTVHTNAPDVGTYGVFSYTFSPEALAASQLGNNVVLEVFQRSPKDGTETDGVAIPLTGGEAQ